ncbi:MAG: hypothetical protein WA231_07795, partial [Methylocella sp.]
MWNLLRRKHRRRLFQQQPSQNQAPQLIGNGTMPDTCYPIGFLCLSNKIDVALIITILFFLAGILLNSKRDRKLHKTALEEEAQKQTKIREEEAQKQA